MKCPYMSKLIIDIGKFENDLLFKNYIQGSPITNSGFTVSNDNNYKTHLSENVELFNLIKSDNSVLEDVYMLYPECIRENCQLWDSINERCGTKVTDTIKDNLTEELNVMRYLENVIGRSSEKDVLHSLLIYLQNILGNNDEKLSAEGTGSTLIRVLNHMHGAHWHPEEHLCPEIPVSCGQPAAGVGGFGTPYASVLIAEYMGFQDLDQNFFIYGHDFMVTDGPTKPGMLKAIEYGPEWVNPNIQVSWPAMLNWYETREDDQDPLLPYRHEKELAVILSNEFYMNQDLDGDSYIYGTDFMVTGDKPKIISQLENEPNWIEPAEKIDWQTYVDSH